MELVWDLVEATAENVAFDFASVCGLAMLDGEPAVREQSYRLAAEDASPRLLDPLLRAVGADPDHEARTAAIDALGVFTLQAQVEDWPVSARDAVQSVLLQQFRSSEADLTLRQAALLSLSYLATPDAEAAIRQAYQEEDMRQTAIEAMGRNCQDIWLSDLRTELQSRQSAHRLQAVLACVEMEDERLVTDLAVLIQDAEHEVRLAAVQAIGAIGGAEAEAALAEAERSSDPALRRAAAQALSEVRGRDEFFSVPPGLTSFEDLARGDETEEDNILDEQEEDDLEDL